MVGSTRPPPNERNIFSLPLEAPNKHGSTVLKRRRPSSERRAKRSGLQACPGEDAVPKTLNVPLTPNFKNENAKAAPGEALRKTPGSPLAKAIPGVRVPHPGACWADWMTAQGRFRPFFKKRNSAVGGVVVDICPTVGRGCLDAAVGEAEEVAARRGCPAARVVGVPPPPPPPRIAAVRGPSRAS